MKAKLKITESAGRRWEIELIPDKIYLIGRAQGNDITLNDRRASRQHAQIVASRSGFKLIDGYISGGEIQRSVNHVYVNDQPFLEKDLETGDRITIGTSLLVIKIYDDAPQPTAPPVDPHPVSQNPGNLTFNDQPLGQTQLFISANEIIGSQTSLPGDSVSIDSTEFKALRRKAQILEMFYEMSKTLGTVFDLEETFARATDLIFRGTPADRVVALLADETVDGKILAYSLSPIASKSRDVSMTRLTEKLTISRTITQKVMREKVALLSQDVTADAQFSGAQSIVSQGVRSTICAPLITESNVHGVVYADRLDPFATFSQDDLELISAVAAQTAVTVEMVKAHRRLAREEVARANYSRFMPEYVVKQLLEKPDSFKLGGSNQTITVLFADIRGFTALSERENPEKIVGLLNRYFSAMSEIIFEHGGTLDKYIGDGLMAIFGAPTATPQDADNALWTAIEMQRRVQSLNQELRAEGYSPFEIGIGLHTGVATVGYIGSDRRSEFTAIGDTVNLASRLESNAESGQILISEATAKAAEKPYSLLMQNPLQVKNRTQPVSLFELKWK